MPFRDKRLDQLKCDLAKSSDNVPCSCTASSDGRGGTRRLTPSGLKSDARATSFQQLVVVLYRATIDAPIWGLAMQLL